MEVADERAPQDGKECCENAGRKGEKGETKGGRGRPQGRLERANSSRSRLSFAVYVSFLVDGRRMVVSWLEDHLRWRAGNGGAEQSRV